LLARIALPTSLTVAIGLAWLAYYFWRVTGSPFTSPYQINIRTYGLVYFPWQHLKPVAPFHHVVMQSFYRDIDMPRFISLAHQHPFELQGYKALVVWLFFFGPLLTAPWLVWIFTRTRWKFWKAIKPDLRFLLSLCACAYISIVLTIYAGQPHYAAPLTVAFYAATLLVIRDLWVTASGRWLARSVFIAATVLFATAVVASIFQAGPSPSWVRIWCSPPLQNLERAHVLDQLEHTPGKHLVIARYRTVHDYAYDEWVSNGADIEGSKVIWARDMGNQNAELLEYFRERKIWLVEPDDRPVKLAPYSR